MRKDANKYAAQPAGVDMVGASTQQRRDKQVHINVKPRDSAQTYVTDADAIQHLWLYACYAKAWQDVHFGRDMRDMRRVDDAIKAKDVAAFRASKRKGYWRVELALGA